LLERIAAADKCRHPRTVRIEEGFLHPGLIGDGARRRIAHRRCIGKDFFHPVVGRKGFALLNPDSSERAERGRVERIDWLSLYDVGD